MRTVILTAFTVALALSACAQPDAPDPLPVLPPVTAPTPAPAPQPAPAPTASARSLEIVDDTLARLEISGGVLWIGPTIQQEVWVRIQRPDGTWDHARTTILPGGGQRIGISIDTLPSGTWIYLSPTGETYTLAAKLR